MSRDVKVRAVRPHDTAQGMKQPGDEYERPADEAEALEKGGIVTIVKRSAKASAPT